MEKNKELARLNDPVRSWCSDAVVMQDAVWHVETYCCFQELVSSLVSSVLAGERAIFYALNFDLQPYKVHDLVMELSDGGLDKNFCTSPQGRNLFKTAWETVVFGCDPCCNLLCSRGCAPAKVPPVTSCTGPAQKVHRCFHLLSTQCPRKQVGQNRVAHVSQQYAAHCLWLRTPSASHLEPNAPYIHSLASHFASLRTHPAAALAAHP